MRFSAILLLVLTLQILADAAPPDKSFGKEASLAHGVLKMNGKCVILEAYFTESSFLLGLRKKDTDKGPVFSRQKELVHQFPDGFAARIDSQTSICRQQLVQRSDHHDQTLAPTISVPINITAVSWIDTHGASHPIAIKHFESTILPWAELRSKRRCNLILDSRGVPIDATISIAFEVPNGVPSFSLSGHL